MPEEPKTLEDALKVISDLTEKANDAEKWKAMSRKNEDRAKENAEKAQKADDLERKLADIEASKLSDAEKTARKLAELEKAVQDAESARQASDLAALKARIGSEKGLHPKLIPLLMGEDETSLSAHADELAEIAKADGGFQDIGQGVRGSASAKLTDPLAKALAAKVGAPIR
jgi:DNA repair ATPase RecN